MNLKDIKKKAADKLEKAKNFVKDNKELVAAGILGAVGIGGLVGASKIKKSCDTNGAEKDDDFDNDYYDKEVTVSIDGIEHKCLYQYLGRDGAALWLDGDQEDSYKELDRHFRED